MFIDIVFDGPPDRDGPRLVEVESPPGTSIKFGEWVRREDGYWVLRLPHEVAAAADLLRAFRLYGVHHSRCAANKWPGKGQPFDACDCGFAAVLAKAEGRAP